MKREVFVDSGAWIALSTDQDFSFVDAVSIADMRCRGIAEAFAFDHHFLIAGFTTVPTVT
ncbi:MAG: hypothetical protein ACR2JY_17915 [Chloroflexota bacterium]